MKTLSFGEMGEFECYRVNEIEAAKVAKSQGKSVMIGRPCTECGDLLFGESLDPKLQLECEEGSHNSRPGVWV